MTLSERIVKSAFRNKLNKDLDFDSKEFFNFIEKHDSFTRNLGPQIAAAVNNGIQPSSEATSALLDLIAHAERLSELLRGTYKTGIILDIAARVLSLQESYNLVYNSYKVTGVSNSEGFATRRLYDDYIVPRGRSLSDIAKEQLGSRSNVALILEDNPELIGKTQKEIELTTIKIRNEARPVPAITSSPNQESWGVDMSNFIELGPDGDILMLSPKDTLLQGATNIILYPFGSVPEDPSCGNYIVSTIGEDNYSISRAVAIRMLLSALQQDDAIESAEINKFDTEQDAFKVSITLKPVNTSEKIDLVL